MSTSGMSLSQCLDLINSTGDWFTPDKLAVVLNTPRYEAVRTLREKKKTASGERYTSNIQLEDATNGGSVGMLFPQDTSNVNDTDQKVISEWKRYTNNVSYDQVQLSINKGDKLKQYDYLKSKKIAMYRKAADDIQSMFWSVPTSSSDTLSPTGIPGWIVMGADNSTIGFNGLNPEYTDGNDFNVGGLSSTTYPKWSNIYVDHNGILNETLLDTLGDCNRQIDFEAPVIPGGTITGVSAGLPDKVAYYTSNNIIRNVEKIARNSDDRIGNDLGKYAGKTLYKGIPFNYVKILDTASTHLYGTDPIFAINFDIMYPVVLDGWFFNSDQSKNATAHTVVTEFIDLVWNIHSENRAEGGYLVSQQ